MAGTVTPFNLVQSVQDSIVPSGSNPANVPRRFVDVPLSSLRLASGAPLAAGSGDVRFASVNTFYSVVQWVTAADGSDGAIITLSVPFDYHEGADEFYARFLLRKTDSADENTNLRFRVQPLPANPGVAGPEVVSSQTVELPFVGDASGGVDGFRWIEFKFSGMELKAGRSALQLTVGPNEAVGSSDMTLDLMAVQLGWRTNIVEFRKHTDRFRTMETGVLDAD